MNVEAVLLKTDLTELVRMAGGNPDNHGRCACPIHGGNDTSAFHIYKSNGKQVWKCFSGDCGGGDVFDFVGKWRGWDFKKSYEFLGGEVHSDPVEMERLAQLRLENAKRELEDKQRRYEAARRELQAAQKHLFYHESMGQWAKTLWTERGLDEGMQSFFTLGACSDFEVNINYHSPTLTIPFLDEQRNLLNIQHRLVNPPNPKDRYRPETFGLGSMPPFLAIPEMGFDGGLVIVVEGAIKSMVTWSRLEISDFQTIGVTSKHAFMKTADELKGKKVLVIPDPQGEKEAYDLARAVGGNILEVPAKIDDYLISTNMSSNNFCSLIRQTRKA